MLILIQWKGMENFLNKLSGIRCFAIFIFVLMQIGISCAPSTGSGQTGSGGLERFFNETEEEESPELPDARELTVRFSEAVNERDFEEAERLLVELYAHPYHDRNYTIFSDAYLKACLGEFEEALSLINSLNPTAYNHNYLDLRSSILRRMGDLDAALNDLEVIMLSRRRDIELRRDSYWELLIMTGDFERAYELEKEVERETSLNIYDFYNMLDRAVYHRDFGIAEQILERMPSNPGMIQSGDSDFFDPFIHLSRTKLYFERGEVDRALENYRSLGRVNFRFTVAWVNLAESAMIAGLFEEARAGAIEGIIRCGGREILDELGIVYDEPGEDVYENFPMQRDEVSSLLSVLGRTSLASGNTTEAFICGRKALEVNRYQSSAYKLLAITYEYIGETGIALEQTYRCMQGYPYDRDNALRYIRLTEMNTGNLNSAYPDPVAVLNEILQWFEDSLEYFPNDPGTAYFLAKSLEYVEPDNSESTTSVSEGETALSDNTIEFDRRLDLMEQAYNETPHDVGITLFYANLLAASGMCDEAREIIDAADLQMDMAWTIEFSSPELVNQADEMCGFSDMVMDAMNSGIE